MEDIGNVDAAGDPLECECPVCGRIKGVIKQARQNGEICDGIGLGIGKNSHGGPENGAGLGRPNLEETIGLMTSELIPNSRQRAADGQKEDLPNTESSRLYIISCIAWTADGREI